MVSIQERFAIRSGLWRYLIFPWYQNVFMIRLRNCPDYIYDVSRSDFWNLKIISILIRDWIHNFEIQFWTLFSIWGLLVLNMWNSSGQFNQQTFMLALYTNGIRHEYLVVVADSSKIFWAVLIRLVEINQVILHKQLNVTLLEKSFFNMYLDLVDSE